MKKILALALAGCMLLGLFAGCTGGGSASTTAANTTASTTKAATTTAAAATTTAAPEKENFNPTGLPIVDEPVSVEVFWQANGKYNEADPNATTTWNELEKATNVHLDWHIVPQGENETTKLYFAAGELADFFFSSLTNDYVTQFGVEGGQFVDISGMIDEYMPNMVKTMDEHPMMRQVVTENNGAIYLLPFYIDVTTAATSQVYYRTDYLAEVGMNEPTTPEELRDVLIAVKDAGLTEGYAPLLMQNVNQFEWFLFPAFGTALESTYADNGDGKVSYNAITEQYRLYLEYMNGLYTEGLIDPEQFSLDSATMNARVKAGQSFAMTAASNLNAEDFPANDGTVYLSAFSPFSTELNNHTQRVKTYDGIGAQCGGINVDCEYVREILRYMDILYGYEEIAPGIVLRGEFGVENISFTVNAAENTYTFLKPDDYEGSSWDWVHENHAWNMKIGILENPYYQTAPNNYAREKAMCEKLKPYAVDFFPAKYLKWADGEKASIATAETDISTYYTEMRAKFITGVEPLDKWEEYVSTIEKMGIGDILAVYQSAYDRWLAA